MPAGFNVPYLVGNTYLRDCQNWPTLTRAQLPTFFPDVDPTQYDNIWQGSLTAAQERILSWRVREWKVEGAIDLTYREIGPSNDALIVASSVLAGTIYSLTKLSLTDSTEARSSKEIDLIKRVTAEPYSRALFKALVNFGFGTEDGGTFPTSTWNSTINGLVPEFATQPIQMNVNSGFVLFDPVTGLFTPNNVGFGSIFTSSYFQGDLSFNNDPQTVLAGTAVIVLKKPCDCTIKTDGLVPDFVLPMQLAWRSTGEAPGDAVTGSADCSVTLTAMRYWTNSNTLGQALYDETTGVPTGANPFA